MAIVLETTIGDMTIDLYTDIRPAVCDNFLKLCQMKYYNFNLFYSVQSNFIAQTGDPGGSGNGGESALSFVKGPEARYITGEKLPRMKHSRPGLVSMVNCGNHLVGSQFFITLGSDLNSLDEHIIFGEVTEGHDTLLKLNDAICDEQNRPYQDIRITHTVVLEDPFDDLKGLIIPPNSPEPSEDMLQTDRIAADETIEDTSKLTEKQLHEIKANQEAKAQATILEIIGDIPDVDTAPPENVLFVCKLNPVTTDDDLEIIFSRFGKINSCEIIRDKKSGDSLQYAFIEFDDKKSCEDAYFKMDNVLIDDRRIHVDFSQSVSKIRWKGKGRGVEYLDDEPSSKKNGRDSPSRNRSRERQRHRNRDQDDKSSRRSRSRSRSRHSRNRHHDHYRSRHPKSRSRSPTRSKKTSRDYSRDRKRRRSRSSSKTRSSHRHHRRYR